MNLIVILGITCIAIAVIGRSGLLDKKPKPQPATPPVSPDLNPDQIEFSLTNLARAAKAGSQKLGSYDTADGRIAAITRMVELAPHHPITMAQLHWTMENDWANTVKQEAHDLLIGIL